MHIVVGTAGHIDHGKTALVKALTGTDTDRLPEEKQRGITIDLGFAEMHEGDVQIGFVDVPGHERFVKNMLAGASGIDLVLLVIAADEGVMPQTREHFDICRLLHIKQGIIVLTKTDLVDDETIDLARLDAHDLVSGSFLKDAPVFAVSAKTGQGIDELKQALMERARAASARQDRLVTRLPIDRRFAVKGFGAVVTGTLASGIVRPADEFDLLPSERRLRVRGVQIHGKAVAMAAAGGRTAVNLGGIDYGEIERGMVLAEPGVLHPGQMFDAEIEVLADASRPLRSRQRVRVNIGTAEVLARLAVINEGKEIEPGSRGFAQVRLESPVVTVAGERFILRSYSPQITVGGGTIIRPTSEKLRWKDAAQYAVMLREFAGALENENEFARLIVRSTGERGATLAEVRSITGWRADVADKTIQAGLRSGTIVNAGGVYLAESSFNSLSSRMLSEIERHHRSEPLSRGISREELRARVFKRSRPEIQNAVTAELEKSGRIVAERDVVKLRSHRAQLSPQEQVAVNKIRAIYDSVGLEVPKLDDVLAGIERECKLDRAKARKILQLLLNSGEIVCISDEYYFSSKTIEDLKSKIREFAGKTPGRVIDVSAFKDLAGVSRKYAIPLLEYFDRTKVTTRSGDKRVVL